MTREESIKYIDNLHKKILSSFADKVSEKEMQSFCMAIEALKEPPRVHAHWNLIIRYDDGIEVFRCSCCSIPRPTKFTYCPSCGAIMDESIVKTNTNVGCKN